MHVFAKHGGFFPSTELLKINLDADLKICFADVAFDFAEHTVMLLCGISCGLMTPIPSIAGSLPLLLKWCDV